MDTLRSLAPNSTAVVSYEMWPDWLSASCPDQLVPFVSSAHLGDRSACMSLSYNISTSSDHATAIRQVFKHNDFQYRSPFRKQASSTQHNHTRNAIYSMCANSCLGAGFVGCAKPYHMFTTHPCMFNVQCTSTRSLLKRRSFRSTFLQPTATALYVVCGLLTQLTISLSSRMKTGSLPPAPPAIHSLLSSVHVALKNCSDKYQNMAKKNAENSPYSTLAYASFPFAIPHIICRLVSSLTIDSIPSRAAPSLQHVFPISSSLMNPMLKNYMNMHAPDSSPWTLLFIIPETATVEYTAHPENRRSKQLVQALSTGR